jgi:hypothetical protein
MMLLYSHGTVPGNGTIGSRLPLWNNNNMSKFRRVVCCTSESSRIVFSDTSHQPSSPRRRHVVSYSPSLRLALPQTLLAPPASSRLVYLSSGGGDAQPLNFRTSKPASGSTVLLLLLLLLLLLPVSLQSKLLVSVT